LCNVAAKNQGLHQRSDDEDDVRNDKSLLATKGIANVEGCHCAEETTSLEDRDDVALEVGEIVAAFDEVERVLERVHCQNTLESC
jgi:hypothetical protein